MTTTANGGAGVLPEARDSDADRAALTTELKELVERANTGEQFAVARLRRLLDEHPEIWAHCGDVSRYAERAWLDLLAGEALAAESVPRHVEQMREELLGPHPTRAERLLVDQVVVSYLAAQHAAIASADPAPLSLGQAALRLKRAESAQRRYLAALRTLTHLRAKLPEGLSPPNSVRLYTEEPTRRKRA